MNKAVKERWVKALRSKKYRQGRRCLVSCDDSRHTRYCCLGLLCRIEGLEIKYGEAVYKKASVSSITQLPSDYRKYIGITKEDERRLMSMNDGNTIDGIRKHTFLEIADYIEENL
jgi:hypothetical protein